MEDLHMNTSQEENFDYSNNTYDYYEYDDSLWTKWISFHTHYKHMKFSMYVFTSTVIGVCLPLTLVAIYALYSQVRNGQVAPIYVINLLITDIIQLCCLIIEVAAPEHLMGQLSIPFFIYNLSLAASVAFMVCVALERYLVVAWPLWYRFRRTIKTSVVVCVVVWVILLIFLLILDFWDDYDVSDIIFAVYFLLPFPLLIFFLGGTLKALSASTVPSDEKRRIVGVLVLVLLIYTLLFMPKIICFLDMYNYTFDKVTFMFLRLSPLADLFLYVFMRKGIIDKLLASVCCCRMDSNDISRSPGNDDNIHAVSSV